MYNSNNAYKLEESFFDEQELQGTLEGFDELWQATEASLPQGYKTPLEKLIDDQKEQILYLNDVSNLLRAENFELRQEMAEMKRKFEIYEKISEDYAGVLHLNRALTKQLNTLMAQRQKEQSQLEALRNLLG